MSDIRGDSVAAKHLREVHILSIKICKFCNTIQFDSFLLFSDMSV